MIPGTRIRMGPTCVWPERRGAVGVVVAPAADGTYPQPGRDEVIVLLDEDPLGYRDSNGRGWTCVTGKKDVEVLGG